jgi:broad specificity phosphatase PhoE
MEGNTNSLIVTHNARLRCLITKLFNNSTSNNNVILRKQIKDFRWQNCCVLKLFLQPTSSSKPISFQLSLIYDGEIDPLENKPGYQYWATKDSPDLTVRPKTKGCIGSFCAKQNNAQNDNNLRFNQFNTLEGVINFSELNDLNLESEIKNIKNDFTFYLVRHGQAEHNLYTKTKIIRKKDTSLTEIGDKGAYKAGVAINNYLKENDFLKYLFTSDLIRTKQTLGGILRGIASKHLFISENTVNVIVLPCSHELAFVSDGKCDASVNIAQPFTSENKMFCTKLNNYNNNTPEFENCVRFNSRTSDNVNIIINIDWSHYGEFYGNSYRGDTNKKIYGTKKKCRNTSMIEESIEIINKKSSLENMGTEEQNLVQAQGGKNKNKRKTKKYRKNHKKTRKKTKRRL